MRKGVLLLGGLKFPDKVLKKYTTIYGDVENIMVRFTFTGMVRGKDYYVYDDLNRKLDKFDQLHIHALSGSAHILYRFMDKFPDQKEKVVSQVYDSPCHIMGVVPTFEKLYGIPPSLSESVVRNVFSDCFETSEQFMKEALVRSVPTGIIQSTNDMIAPLNMMDKMITNWEKTNDIQVHTSDSEHLNTFRDYPSQYTKFCQKIFNDDDDVINKQLLNIKIQFNGNKKVYGML